ncbi:MAG: SusC/RagA family TonB-linked outer membrane protein, partial [Bacteroidales bacterium]|nr:SusC/RagA family TonB-linked outer membrane protein [Bacteroidales bacterium]
ITVLKDASATAIYGSRAANGVIIIETKKGKLGKPSVTYTGQFGLDQSAKQMEMMTPYEYVNYQIERRPEYFDKYLTNCSRTMEDYLNYPPVNWQDKVFRNAFTQTHNLSMMGGTSQTRYSASFNAVDQNGVIVNSGFKKYQGRLSLEQQIGKNFRLSINGSYTDATVYGQTASSILASSNSYSTYLMYRVWAFRPVSFTENDEYEIFEDDAEGMDSSSTMNPVISNLNEQSKSRTTTFMANAKLTWNILPYLKLAVRGGYTDKIITSDEFNNSKTVKGFPRITNVLGVNASINQTRRVEWMNENTLTFSKTFKKMHKVNVMVGNTIQGNKRDAFGLSAAYIPNENLGLSGMDDGIPNTIAVTLSDNRLLSFFGRPNYGYGDRYLATVTMRADGSSKFAPGHKWGYFPSAALAWRFGQEKWMKKVRWVQDAKLRLSYGLTGNNRVGDYSSYSTISIGDYYPFNNSPEPAAYRNAMGNTDLTWETTRQLDLGLDLKLWEGRFSFTFDIYDKVTSDLLLNAKIPYSTGFTTVYKNVGKVQNRGLEVTINTINVHTRDFMWTSDLNFAFNQDKVLELADSQQTLLSSVKFTGSFNSTNLYIAQVGKPIASFYGLVWDGMYGVDDFDLNAGGQYVLKEGVPTNGDTRAVIQPGDIKYVDQNGDGVVNDQDMVVIGRGTPFFTGGFNNTLTWRGFDLNFFFQWSVGNMIMNANRLIFEGNYANKTINQFRSYNDHQDSRNFRVGGQGPDGLYSTRTLEDGSFLRLKTLQLSYTLPKRISGKLKMDVLKFTIAGQNLWTLSKYSGLDPEVSIRHTALTPGFDFSAYARTRSFTAGVSVTF